MSTFTPPIGQTTYTTSGRSWGNWGDGQTEAMPSEREQSTVLGLPHWLGITETTRTGGTGILDPEAGTD